MNRQLPGRLARAGTALSLSLLAFAYADVTTSAQDRLKTMPGYAQYQRLSAQLNGAVRSGAINGTWSADSSSVEYVSTASAIASTSRRAAPTEIGAVADAAGAGRGGRGGGRGGTGIERGRQAASADAPDGKLKAFYRDRNLWVSDAAGANESPITTDGNEKDRIKYGTASWVYGEELAQTSAMWWSPDSRKVAYYRFDEKQVLDYNLQLDQTKIQSANDVEAYPKAGRRQPDRRSVGLRRRHEEEHEGRRPRRQAVRQQRRRPLRLSRVVVARRPRAALQPHQPPSERPRVRRRQSRRPARRGSSCAKSGRPAGSTTGRRCSS